MMLRIAYRYRILQALGKRSGSAKDALSRRFHIRPSPACPPEYLRGLYRTSVISAPRIEHINRDSGFAGIDNVVLFGAGKVGRDLAYELIQRGTKGLVIVDKNRAKCMALFEDIKQNFPRTIVSYKIGDIMSQMNIEEVLREATVNMNGQLDVVVDATNIMKEDSKEDTLTTSTMVCNGLHRKCLENIKQNGHMITFGSSEGLTPALYEETSVCKYESISTMGETEVTTHEFVKMCMEKIQKSKLLGPSGKVVISFIKPKLVDASPDEKTTAASSPD